MIKRKWAVGDRVAVYLGAGRFVGKVEGWLNGEINTVNITIDGYRYSQPFHRKQCRRLRPAQKARRVWLDSALIPDAEGGQASISVGPIKVTSLGPLPGFVEFREVRKKREGES